MVVFVSPVELPVPVGDMGSDVVPLGVTVVIDPPLSTDTNGRAEDSVDEAEVIIGDGAVVDGASVEEVNGATRIYQRRNLGDMEMYVLELEEDVAIVVEEVSWRGKRAAFVKVLVKTTQKERKAVR